MALARRRPVLNVRCLTRFLRRTGDMPVSRSRDGGVLRVGTGFYTAFLDKARC